MGDSEKLDPSEGESRYSLTKQYEYLGGFLEALEIRSNVIFVVHSWGATLASHWAASHSDAVKGIVFMECSWSPFDSSTMPPQLLGFVQAIRSEAGEAMILTKNMMLETAIRGGTIRSVDDATLDNYRRPFLDDGEARRAMLSFARSIPVDDGPEESLRMMESGSSWLSASDLPKLLVVGDPGSSMTEEERLRVTKWSNVTEVKVEGKHLLTEDSPDEIGAAISSWYEGSFPC